MAARGTQQPKDHNKAQVEAFRKAARELGCDESEERFQEALRKVAKHSLVKRKRLGRLSKSSRNI
jgi:hypothetical protein